MCSSNRIFTRFGVTAFEIMSIGLKPIIIYHNESIQRLKDIKNLENNNFLILFHKFIENKKMSTVIKKNIKLNFGAPKFINLLKRI